MKPKVLQIRHMPGERQDRVSAELRSRGFELDTRWIAEGHELPDAIEDYDAAVIYGGAQMVEQVGELDYLRREIDWIGQWMKSDKPLLGICLGAQMIAHTLGGRVGPHADSKAEIGFFPIEPTPEGQGLIPDEIMVYHWHLQGFEAPPDSTLLARGPVFEHQAFRYGRNVYGLQFHPEITRDIQASWLEAGAHLLELPGAQSREQQLAATDKHLAPLGDWLRGFMDTWIGTAVTSAHQAS